MGAQAYRARRGSGNSGFGSLSASKKLSSYASRRRSSAAKEEDILAAAKLVKLDAAPPAETRSPLYTSNGGGLPRPRRSTSGSTSGSTLESANKNAKPTAANEFMAMHSQMAQRRDSAASALPLVTTAQEDEEVNSEADEDFPEPPPVPAVHEQVHNL